MHISHNNKEKILQFIISLLFFFCTYGILTSNHFALDTYFCCAYEQVTPNLQSGRWLGAIIFALLNNNGIYAGNMQGILTIIHIILVSFSASLLFWTVIEEINSKNKYTNYGICGAVYLTFCNVFYLELFLFSENGLTMGLGILFCTLAIYSFLKYHNTLKGKLLSFVLLFLSLGIYQAFLGVFIPWGLIIIFCNDMQTNKVRIKTILNIIIIGGVASICNIVILKFLIRIGIANGSTRQPVLSLFHIFSNAKEILKHQKEIWISAYNFLPKGILIFIILVSLFVIWKTDFKKSILYSSGILCCSIIVLFAAHLLTPDVWMPPRTIIGVFAIIASLLCAAIAITKKYKYILSIIVILVICVNVIQIQKISANHFASNRLDQEYAKIIQKAINDYESTSGNIIKYIAATNDTEPTWFYEGIQYVSHEINNRAYAVSWADVEILNYYSKRNYIKIPMDKEIYNKYFKNKNWNYFNADKQLIFDNETLYWIKY